MDTLRALRFFVRTMELGSLSAAAREFGTTQPTVSKVLAGLERELNVRLLERSTKGPVPTEQGLRFYDHATAVLERYEAALGSVQAANAQATGFLRIAAPVALGQFRVNALVQDFLARHPGISVELILDDRFADLVEDGVDIALRLGAALPPTAIARHLAVVPRFFVASPDYVKRRGMPRAPQDLASHDFVRFAWSPGNSVDMHRRGQVVKAAASSRFRVNNALAIREALVLGSGIGLCPEWLVHDLLQAGALVRVFPGWSASRQDLHLLYPSRRYLPERTRRFIDFIAGQFPGLPGFCKPPPRSTKRGAT
jgi:DNA-binding transcriptional LysR family regulator